MTRQIAHRVTIIGHHRCSDCGSMQPVVVNKGGRGYFFCAGSDPDGMPCRVEHKLSPYLSRKLIDAYVGGKDPANVNAPPAPHANKDEPPKPRGGTLFDD